jgi:hypothetical protein
VMPLNVRRLSGNMNVRGRTGRLRKSVRGRMPSASDLALSLPLLSHFLSPSLFLSLSLFDDVGES